MKNLDDLKDLFLATYREGGRGNGVFDCFGLFAQVCKRRGIEVGEFDTPESIEERQALILEGASSWLKLEHPEPWCGVALRIGRFVAHMGVVLDDGVHFIHANRNTGVTMTRLDDPRWARRIAGFYRHV